MPTSVLYVCVTPADIFQWPMTHKPAQHIPPSITRSTSPCCVITSASLCSVTPDHVHIGVKASTSQPPVWVPCHCRGSGTGVSLKRFTASDLDTFKRCRTVQIFHGANGCTVPRPVLYTGAIGRLGGLCTARPYPVNGTDC